MSDQKRIGIDRGKFLGEMMLWCFRWGCEVQLRNKAWNTPLQDPDSPHRFGEYHERDRNGDLVDLLHAHHPKYVQVQIPELVFSRGDRHVSIYGQDWGDLLRLFEHQHRRIYMELSVPILGEENMK